jgi:hypothetical protein
LKKIIHILIFVLLCFAMVELSYRYYTSGDAAFTFERFNSLNLLLHSGLVQRSEYPSILYELKPDIDALFQDSEFKTNSAGMVDKEYSKAKPENTLRIALVGSSWTMGSGVSQDSAYHSLLETELSAQSKYQNYEFLNFGVEHYGLREIVATARHRAIKWDPDILVVTITPFTAKLRWDEPGSDEELPEQEYSFFKSYVLRTLDNIMGTKYYATNLASRPIIKLSDDKLYQAQLERAFQELHQIAAEEGIPLMVMWLSYRQPQAETEAFLQKLSAEYDVIFVDTYNWLDNANKALLYSGRFNRHPNAYGHELIAQSLKESLIENNLLQGL